MANDEKKKKAMNTPAHPEIGAFRRWFVRNAAVKTVTVLAQSPGLAEAKAVAVQAAKGVIVLGNTVGWPVIAAGMAVYAARIRQVDRETFGTRRNARDTSGKSVRTNRGMARE